MAEKTNVGMAAFIADITAARPDSKPHKDIMTE